VVVAIAAAVVVAVDVVVDVIQHDGIATVLEFTN
jgi:hypothetical protein